MPARPWYARTEDAFVPVALQVGEPRVGRGAEGAGEVGAWGVGLIGRAMRSRSRFSAWHLVSPSG